MRKLLLIAIITSASWQCFSQFKIGIKLDPNISLTRLEHENADEIYSDIKKGVTKAKLNMSLFADIPLLNHVDLEVGLGWGNNTIGFKVDYLADDTSSNEFKAQNLEFALQYLNIPVGLKLYTNDIARNMRIYVNVGSKLGFRLDESQKEDLGTYEDEVSGKNFTKWFDSSLRIGAGVEIKVGSSNIAFVGFEYERGLANVVSKDYLNIEGNKINKSNLSAYNDQIKLVLGFKF